jgi:hypothetical protein
MLYIYTAAWIASCQYIKSKLEVKSKALAISIIVLLTLSINPFCSAV